MGLDAKVISYFFQIFDLYDRTWFRVFYSEMELKIWVCNRVVKCYGSLKLVSIFKSNDYDNTGLLDTPYNNGFNHNINEWSLNYHTLRFLDRDHDPNKYGNRKLTVIYILS